MRRLKYPPPEPLGMLAHYKFDQQSGQQVAEATGQQPAAKIVGSAAPVNGKIGEALEFSGNGYVECGPILPLDRDDKFSLGAWVQTVSKEQGDILARTESQTNWRGYDLYIEGGACTSSLSRRERAGCE